MDRRGFVKVLAAVPLAAVLPVQKSALMFHKDAFVVTMAPLTEPRWVVGSSVLKAGDIFTIAGKYVENPRGVLQEFVVDKAVSSDS